VPVQALPGAHQVDVVCSAAPRGRPKPTSTSTSQGV
jgi:hypothetical protein